MKLDLTVPAGLDPYVAGAVSPLEFGRKRLQSVIEGLTPEQLAATFPGFANSIATLAVHIAGYEFVCAHRIAGTPVPDEIKTAFLLDKPMNPLPVAEGETAESLIARLERSRAYLLEHLAKVTAADLDRECALGPERTATVRWVLGLISYHQNEHLGQILLLKKLVTQA
jgi:uncharacterized damage-inducible protein DinB